MLKKRIIPCLDVKDGRTVKGVNFKDLRDAGDAVELGSFYSEQGADELVFLDISASLEKRQTVVDLTRHISRDINIPFTIGGGIKSLTDASRILESGADKISINTAALARPELIDEIAREFGSQFLVLAVDIRREGDQYDVYSHGGTKNTGRKVHPWIDEAWQRGAGEILLTSMDKDGTKSGYDISITRSISSNIKIPVIASGGAGTMEHFTEVFREGQADAALAASLFHFAEISIPELKNYLKQENVAIR